MIGYDDDIFSGKLQQREDRLAGGGGAAPNGGSAPTGEDLPVQQAPVASPLKDKLTEEQQLKPWQKAGLSEKPGSSAPAGTAAAEQALEARAAAPAPKGGGALGGEVSTAGRSLLGTGQAKYMNPYRTSEFGQNRFVGGQQRFSAGSPIVGGNNALALGLGNLLTGGGSFRGSEEEDDQYLRALIEAQTARRG